MKLFSKIVLIFIISAVVVAQERDDNSFKLFKRPSFLDQNPVGNFVGGIRDRVKESRTRITNGIQSVIDEVHKRTQQLEQTFTGHLSRLRPKAVDASNKLKALEEQKNRLNEEIKVYNNEFEEKKSEYKEALKHEKDVIDNQISTSRDTGATKELKNESEEIVKKIKMVDDLKLEPGLGDGYGRHL